jgi:hypothetical protein
MSTGHREVETSSVLITRVCQPLTKIHFHSETPGATENALKNVEMDKCTPQNYNTVLFSFEHARKSGFI